MTPSTARHILKAYQELKACEEMREAGRLGLGTLEGQLPPRRTRSCAASPSAARQGGSPELPGSLLFLRKPDICFVSENHCIFLNQLNA